MGGDTSRSNKNRFLHTKINSISTIKKFGRWKCNNLATRAKTQILIFPENEYYNKGANSM